ncbi:MAG: protoheme IX farnesyltransferase [Bauldia sp.]|nr:protoheme IX farnesyltransferase [Bauldia sp.]
MAFVDKIDPAAAEPRISSASAGDYFALLKPRVMSLVIFTAAVGLLLAPGGIDPFVGFVSLLAIAVGAGASGALNMWYDADIDARMARTRTRPVPAGRVTPNEALAFGLILSALSVAVLGLASNWVAGGLLAFTIFFYAVIYTMWLKRWTVENIVIGGAAGALPPMVAWAAVTGTVSIESITLFLIIFMWTPPHFWSLALLKTEDYKRVGVPMLPVVRGEAVTARRILIYSILLAPVGVAPYFLGMASVAYGIVAAGLGGIMIFRSIPIVRSGGLDRVAARRLFGFSLFYLFIIFVALLVDRGIDALGIF